MPRANAAPAFGEEGDEEPQVPAVVQRELHDILRLLEDMRQSREDDRVAAEAAAEAAVAAALVERTRVDALFAALNLAPPAVPPRPFAPPVRPPPAISWWFFTFTVVNWFNDFDGYAGSVPSAVSCWTAFLVCSESAEPVGLASSTTTCSSR